MNRLINCPVRVLLVTALTMLCALSAAAQTKVSGTVTEENGTPMPGVAVVIKGTTEGTSTDIDGKYTISTSQKDAVLEISFIGYATQEIPVGGRDVIDVVLSEDVSSLDEIVVVGYAVGNKRTVSGAIDKISAADMNKGYVTSATDAIRGKVAGLVVSQNGGNVTDSPTVRIRGTSSLSGGNDPLVIIDGVFGDMKMLEAIAPDEIQEMTVLKDASETAQYGSRGAAGVIVVTTRRGQDGRRDVSYSGQIGVSTASKNLEVLSADDWRSLNTSKFSGTGLDKGYSTDWIKWIQNNFALQNNHHLSFSNGNAKSNMRASIGIRDNKGIVRNTGKTTYNARLAAQQKAFGDILTLDINLAGSYTKENYVTNDIFSCAAGYNPTFSSERNPDTGLWDYDPNNHSAHPGDIMDYTRDGETGRIVASGRATVKIIDGLTASVFGSFNYDNKLTREYYPFDTKEYMAVRGEANAATTRNINTLGSVQVNYNKTIGKHSINALVLAEGQKYNYWYDMSKVNGFDTNYFLYNNFEAGAIVKYGYVKSNAYDYTLMSYMGRFNYMYDDRYVITLNARGDGSSKLGDNHKWGFFPSASVAWLITGEKWMKSQKVLNNLKLRVGYGVTGNQDAISPYNSLKLLSPNGLTEYEGAKHVTFALASNPNPDLRWETKYTFDVGLDFGLWDNRFTGTIDGYFSKTKDLLYTYTVPVPPFAYTTLLANIGEMTNRGVEISLRGVAVETKDWNFTVSATAAYNKNKVVSLSGTYNGSALSTAKYISLASASCSGLTSNTHVVFMTEGEPVNIFRLPVHDGFNVDEKGHKTYKFKDVNGDGGITLDDEGDREQLGQATPKVTAGLNLALRFRNWDLTTQFNGAFGHKIYNFSSLRLSNLSGFPTFNVLKSAPDLGVYDVQHTSYWLEDGDYVNIEYVTLGYNVPLKKAKYLTGLRLALSCNNVFTFTRYSGMTPVLDNQKIGAGIDNNIFPVLRTWSFQLGINF